MRHIALLTLILFTLAACGGAPADTTVADPPQAQPFTSSDNPTIARVLEGWRREVPAALQSQQIKPETIEEKVYRSDANLQEIAAFYEQLVEKGWYSVKGMPGVQDGVLLTGYEIGGTTTLVIGALDTSKLGESGVVIYTAKGSK